MDVTELRKKLEKFNQEHLLTFWDELNNEQKNILFEELNQLDFNYVTESFERCTSNMNNKTFLPGKMEPLPSNTGSLIIKCTLSS